MAKNKFYTNVQMYGNSILFRGYENGETVQCKKELFPHTVRILQERK